MPPAFTGFAEPPIAGGGGAEGRSTLRFDAGVRNWPSSTTNWPRAGSAIKPRGFRDSETSRRLSQAPGSLARTLLRSSPSVRGFWTNELAACPSG